MGTALQLKPLALLSGQTAAWLNVIIVMQQCVFLSRQGNERKWAGVQRIQLCSCGSRPTERAARIQLDLGVFFVVFFPLSPNRPPAHSRCAHGYQDAPPWPLETVSVHCKPAGYKWMLLLKTISLTHKVFTTFSCQSDISTERGNMICHQCS